MGALDPDSAGSRPVDRRSAASRTVPLGFGARIVSGAVSGAAVGAAGGTMVGGADAGIAGAVIGTLAGHAFRATLAAAFRKDRPAAFIEDAIARRRADDWDGVAMRTFRRDHHPC